MSDINELSQSIKQKLSQTESGSKALKHIAAIMDYSLTHKEDAVEAFEENSIILKKTAPQEKKISPTNDHLIKWVNSNLSLYDNTKPKKNELGYVPNLIEDFAMMSWAGITLPECHISLLQKAINKIANTTECSSIRFWGIIYGKQKDYYIIEANSSKPEDDDIPQNQEIRGKGVNEHIYYVATNLLEDWAQLPDALPEFIQLSRKFKYLFSGNLEEIVHVYPFFEGKEKHLLRAQIARIAHGTTLCPKNIYNFNADKGEIESVEDAALPTIEELAAMESWLHFYRNLLNMGRITHYVEPKKEQADTDKELEDLKAKDPEIDALKIISEDEKYEGMDSWIIKTFGDQQAYVLTTKEGGNAVYSVGSIKSLRWPGAYTIFQSGRWLSIYIGSGVKATNISYQPIAPQEIKEDPDDIDEFPEPNPKDALEKLESDTDAVKPDEPAAENA